MDNSEKGSMQAVNRCMRKNFRVPTVREMQVRALQHLTPVRMAGREKKQEELPGCGTKEGIWDSIGGMKLVMGNITAVPQKPRP